MDVSGFQVLVLLFCAFSAGVSILVLLLIIRVAGIMMKIDRGVDIILGSMTKKLEEKLEEMKRGHKNFSGVQYEKGVN